MKRIYVVGLGSGCLDDMTIKAKRVLDSCHIIAGYKAYIDLVKPILGDKIYIESSMKQEVQRCEQVLQIALQSEESIALISSGDSGIYGMAGIMIEIAANYNDIIIEIIPGITAATVAASIVGAPLMNDFSIISLSDLLTPWYKIEKRIEYATIGDFVIALYNPKSHTRVTQLSRAIDIIKKYRSLETPVAIVKRAGRIEQSSIMCSLLELENQVIDMFTTIIIGNSETYVLNDKMITPRGYAETPRA